MEENIPLTFNYLEAELILQFLWQVSLVIRALAMSLPQQLNYRSVSLKAEVSLGGWRNLCLRAESEHGKSLSVLLNYVFLSFLTLLSER